MPQGQLPFQDRLEPLKEVDILLDEGAVARHATAVLFPQAFQSAFHHHQVIEDKLGIHGLNIAYRVDAPSLMRHAGVFELTHHMHKAIHLRQLVKERTG